jgi:Homeodomain-like domain
MARGAGLARVRHTIGTNSTHESHFSVQIAGMHPPHVRAEAIALIEQDLNDCEVSRRLGIPRGTIRDWRRPTYVSRRETTPGICPRCWRAAKAIRFTPDDYAELLGLYLGDGWISPGPRTFRLRIALDAKYPVIIQETRQLLLRSMPENAVYVLRASLTGSSSTSPSTRTISPVSFRSTVRASSTGAPFSLSRGSATWSMRLRGHSSAAASGRMGVASSTGQTSTVRNRMSIGAMTSATPRRTYLTSSRRSANSWIYVRGGRGIQPRGSDMSGSIVATASLECLIASVSRRDRTAKFDAPAAVAELVDARVSGTRVPRDVEVRILSAA